MEPMNDFITGVQVKLSDIAISLEKIKEESAGLDDTTRDKINNILSTVDSKRAELEEKLEVLKEKGSTAFEAVEEGIRDGLDSIGDSFKKARNELKK